MKTIFLAACLLSATTMGFGDWTDGRDLKYDLPILEVHVDPASVGFEYQPDVAQYREGDWSGCVGMAQAISLTEALVIADQNPEITFFFYVKGTQMVLQTETDYRSFWYGDAVFFTGEPHFGSAPGLSDGYVRVK